MGYEFINGSTLITRGAKLAKCNFYAGYPISPAVQFHLTMLKELPLSGGIAIQGEDEIASISMCIGASMSGKKAMTTTSGPGIHLCSENIDFAIMAEVPLVIVDIQRLGPSTGGATTNAEGDIQLVRNLSSGGMPMVVLSPSSMESLVPLTIKAFNVAEILRTPVILLTSKEMMQSKQTVDVNNRKFETLEKIKKRKLYRNREKYIPYSIKSPEDIPEFLPLGSKHLVRFTSSMHDEHGRLTKDPDKIEHKLNHLNQKILNNQAIIESLFWDKEAGSPTLIICYGGLAQACREVIRMLRKDKIKISILIIESLFPIPETAIKKALKGINKIILPELNMGQYIHAIKHLFNKEQKITAINRYNGRMLSPGDIIKKGKLR